MAHLFQFSGSYRTHPQSAGCGASGQPDITVPLQESMSLQGPPYIQEITLADDTTVAVNFGALSAANVIILKTIGGKVRARITSADGSLQSVPVDTLFLLLSKSVGVTALDLTRVAGSGVTVTVEVTLGKVNA